VYVLPVFMRLKLSYRFSQGGNHGTAIRGQAKTFPDDPLVRYYVVATQVFYYIDAPRWALFILYLFVARLSSYKSNTLGRGKCVEQAHTPPHVICTDRTSLLGLYSGEPKFASAPNTLRPLHRIDIFQLSIRLEYSLARPSLSLVLCDSSFASHLQYYNNIEFRV